LGIIVIYFWPAHRAQFTPRTSGFRLQAEGFGLRASSFTDQEPVARSL